MKHKLLVDSEPDAVSASQFANKQCTLLFESSSEHLKEDCAEIVSLKHFQCFDIRIIACRDLNIKRSICKGCRALLIAGVTCTVRLRKKKLMWTCSVCNTVRTYNVSTKHQLWLDHPDSVVETLNYETNNL